MSPIVRKSLDWISSIKLTIICLAAAMLLVVALFAWPTGPSEPASDGPTIRARGALKVELTVRRAERTFAFREGVLLRAGDKLLLWYPSANRDEAVFEDPFTFRIDRAPNPHLAFGIGEHFCLGAHLARMEARIAIGGLVERFPELRLESESVEWGPSLFRVPGRLPVRIGAPAA